MRRLSKLFVVALVSILAVQIPSAKGADIKEVSCGPNGEKYLVYLTQGVATSGLNCVGNLIIDSTVRTIGRGAFSYSKITSLNIPNSVTKIEPSAFSNTYDLREAKLGTGITEIPVEAFRASFLRQISLSDTLEEIRDKAFSQTQLESVIIPNSVKTIGEEAFAYTQTLKSVQLSNNLSSIGRGAFTSTQIASISLPSTLQQIGNSAFSGTLLKVLELPKSLKYVGEASFSGTKIEELRIPDSVEFLPSKVFGGMESLRTASIPDKFEKFPDDLFSQSYLVSKIEYCGSFDKFPIKPICPPDRKIALEKAKAEKEKADSSATNSKTLTDFERQACDSSRQQLATYITTFDEIRRRYPQAENEIRILYPKGVKLFRADCGTISKEMNGYVSSAFPLVQKYLVGNTRTTITCVKGKMIRKVSGANPKCPSGFRLKTR